jgi:hypothetical protein
MLALMVRAGVLGCESNCYAGNAATTALTSLSAVATTRMSPAQIAAISSERWDRLNKLLPQLWRRVTLFWNSMKNAERPVTNKEKRAKLESRQAAEIEAAQIELRRSIAETERLVSESEKRLRRHRQEREDEGNTSD